MVRIDLIDPSPWADLFDHPEDHVSRLAEDIRERGIQTPLHVYPTGERFELLTGHDRLAAAKLAGLVEVPVETRSTLNDEDARFAYVVKDNTLRKDVDKRAVARAAWKRWPTRSVSWIASVAACSVGLAHEERQSVERAHPELFTHEKSVGVDGKERPARKPAATGRRKDKPTSNVVDFPAAPGHREDALRKMREDQFRDAPSAVLPDPGETKHCDVCGKDWLADLPACPYCTRPPEQRIQELQEARRDRALYSSDSTEWYTPADIVERVTRVLGSIDLDPCSNSKDAPNVPAEKHYTVDDDGLAQEWSGAVYMNPPYGRGIEAWIEKLVGEYREGAVTAAVALVPARTDTQWFRLLRDFPVCFVTGRLRFSGADPAPFPSCAVYLGADVGAFYAAFHEIGDIYVRMHSQAQEAVA